MNRWNLLFLDIYLIAFNSIDFLFTFQSWFLYLWVCECCWLAEVLYYKMGVFCCFCWWRYSMLNLILIGSGGVLSSHFSVEITSPPLIGEVSKRLKMEFNFYIRKTSYFTHRLKVFNSHFLLCPSRKKMISYHMQGYAVQTWFYLTSILPHLRHSWLTAQLEQAQ